MISELIFFSQFQGSKVSGGTKLLSALILISYGQQTKTVEVYFTLLL